MTITALLAFVGVVLLARAFQSVALVRTRHRVACRVDTYTSSAGPTTVFVLPKRLHAAIVATGVNHRPETVFAAWAGACAFGACLATVVAGPAMAAMVVLVALGLGAWALRSYRFRRRDIADRSLVGVLETMARLLRAGSSMTQALRDVEVAMRANPLGGDLSGLVAAVDRGRPLAETLDAWASGALTVPRHLAATALSLAASSGGAPARLIDSVALTLRERDDLEREARALSTQARASAAVMAAAPFVFAAMAAMIDPAVMDFLLHSVVGLGCIVVGLVLEAVGGWWMSVLIGRRA